MTGRHRMPSADGTTAGTAFLGAVGAGLSLVGAQVSTAIRVDAAPVGVERPDIPPAEPAALADGHPAALHVRCCGAR